MLTPEEIGEGFLEIAEYPFPIGLPEKELIPWTALLDMAGKPRTGRLHQPVEWMVHAHMVRNNGKGVEGYLGNAHHFRRICDCFFNVEGSMLRVEWNPHTVKIIDEFFANKFLALLGSASSGKSFTMALLGVVMFMINPRFTKVLVTCTTKEAGMGKIWGDINNAWDQLEKVFREWGLPLPGKMMSEPVMVRYQHPEYHPGTGWKITSTSHKSGLQLIATLQSSEKQTVATVQGYKNDTVIFLGDEWDSFSPALADTITGNLSSNKHSHCVASFNISGRSSAGGLISTPKEGWDSVTPEDDEWEGVHGKVLRFDAEKSPNVIAGYEKWKGLATVEYVEKLRETHGEESIKWWMFVKAWPPPTGESRFIYSENELTKIYLADTKVTTWLETPKRIAALDPDFTFGGDGALLMVFNIGDAQIVGVTRKVLEIHRAIEISKYVTPTGGEHSKQVVMLTKRFMEDPTCGFELKNLGIDITGATSFGTLVNELVGTGWIPVDSRSKPTELPVSKADTRKGTDVFESLLSEMWLAPKALIRSGQIKGLDDETRREMCLRCFNAANSRGREEVESKKIMKKRNKKMSPNRADALFIGIHVARTKHGLFNHTEAAGLRKNKGPLSPMQKYYQDNPHLKPKIPKWRPRAAVEQLRTTHSPW